MQPDVVAHLLSEVEHKWEKTALAALMGKESEANALQQMQQSCQKVAKSIIDGSEGDKERIMEYMTEVCSASNQDKKVCDEFSAHIDAVVSHDAYHNREELDLSAFCGSFYQESVVERAKKQQQVLQAEAAEQKKQEEAKAAEVKKQEEAKAREAEMAAHQAKAAERAKDLATAEKEVEEGAAAIKEADATAAGIEKDGQNVKALVEQAQKELQAADEKDVAAAEAQAAQAAADAAAKRAAVAARKAADEAKAAAAKKKADEKKTEEKKVQEKTEEKKVEEKKSVEKKEAAAPEKKPVVAALAVHHCPKCGSLVCPHGFTAQESEGHCCPYCVNPAISTEVVKDPAYYAEKAAPVYKKYR